MSVQPPQPAGSQQRGLLNRIINWMAGAIQTAEIDIEGIFNDLIKNFNWQDAEAIGTTVLNLGFNLWMNSMMLNVPADSGKSRGLLGKFQSSAIGMSLIGGLGNLAGSIPSLGQVNNVGETAENVVNNLGMGYMNYQMMRPMMTETMEKPLTSDVREKAAAETLSLDQVQEAYKKGVISEEEMTAQVQELGFREQYVPVVKELSKQPVDVNTLAAMRQNGAITDEQMATLLRQNGYDAEVIPQIMAGTVNTRSLQTQKEVLSIVTQMAKDNHLSETQFTDILQALGKTSAEINDEIVALRSVTAIKGIQDEINNMINLFKQGQLDEEQLANTLKELGVSEENISSLIQNETEAIVRSNPTAELIKINQAYEKGILTSDAYIEKVQQLGYSEETTLAKLVDEDIKVQQMNGTKLQKSALAQAEVNLAYSEGLIDSQTFRILSESVGTPTALVDQILNTLAVGKRKSSKPIPLNLIEQGVELKVINIDDAKMYIQANGYSAQESSIIAEIMSKAQQLTTGSEGADSASGLGGNADTNTLSPLRYLTELSAFDIGHEVAIAIIAMFYNSLIRGNFIDTKIGVTLMQELGISESDAKRVIG